MRDFKIGIYGDSFADPGADNSVTKDEGGWPTLLLNKLGYPKCDIPAKQIDYEAPVDYLLRGGSGTSAWWSYKNFITDLEFVNLDYVVFAFTTAYRIPHLPEEYGCRHHMPIVEGDTEWNNILKVYSTLYNEELAIFMLQSIWNSVQSICKKKNIRIINIVPFSNSNLGLHNEIDFSNRAGPVIIGLNDMSIDESGCDREEYPTVSKYWKGTTGIDCRFCHLTLENNTVVADKIYELLYSTDKNIYDISKAGIYNNTIWQRYSTYPFGGKVDFKPD